MTFDDRLDRLTEKVEATAKNLDLLTRIHLDSDREYRERFRQIEDLVQGNETRVGQLMDTMNRLGRIIEIHDQRLDDLEGR